MDSSGQMILIPIISEEYEVFSDNFLSIGRQQWNNLSSEI